MNLCIFCLSLGIPLWRLDFIHTCYHNQVLWVADALKIEFGLMPKLGNYFMILVCPHAFLSDVCIDFIHVRYHDQVPWVPGAWCMYNLVLCQNWVIINMILVCPYTFLRDDGTDFIHAQVHRCLMYVKYNLSLCQNGVIMTSFTMILCDLTLFSKMSAQISLSPPTSEVGRHLVLLAFPVGVGMCQSVSQCVCVSVCAHQNLACKN